MSEVKMSEVKMSEVNNVRGRNVRGKNVRGENCRGIIRVSFVFNRMQVIMQACSKMSTVKI